MAALLEVKDLSVSYGKVEAVHSVSLSVTEGGIVSVIGPNGAGKTTLLAAIMGTLAAKGEIRYRGESVGSLSVEQRVGSGLVLVPEKRDLFASMTVADNLELGAFARARRGDRDIARTLDDVYARFPRLLERRMQLAGTLSGGERQMLALGRALMSKPKLLMLDEPSLGLAPLLVREIFEIIKRINEEEKTTILLVEQNARVALSIAHYGYIMENGKIVLDDTVEKLKENEDIKEFYLGLSQVGGKKSFRDVKHYRRRKRWLS
jgi:branched-chain amino acid transport system ATP-binding protein